MYSMFHWDYFNNSESECIFFFVYRVGVDAQESTDEQFSEVKAGIILNYILFYT